MAITVTNKLNDLRTLFNDVEEIYFKNGELKSTDLATALTVDFELPVLEDGISFDTGQADVSNVKLTTGAIWTSKAKKGDPSISFQVASVAGVVNDLLLNNVKAISGVSGIINGATYGGAGYSLAPKKVTGALIMMSQDRHTVIVLPNAEIYSSLVAADGDNPSYFNVTVTPLENSEGADIFILSKTT